jgi:hypothetical protein
MVERRDFMTVSEHNKRCSIVRWGMGIAFTAIGVLITMVGMAITGSNRAAADAADVQKELTTHEAVQKVVTDQIKDDLATIKSDVKEIKAKLK